MLEAVEAVVSRLEFPSKNADLMAVMYKFKSLIHLLAILFLVSGLFPNYLLAQEPLNSSTVALDPIHQAIAKMTLDQKVGQLFMIGFSQASLDPKLKTFLAKIKPGSFLLFKRNIKSLEQVRELNRELTQLSLENTGVKPLIAVDQEGGFVSRIPVQPPMPSALAFGQTQSLSLAEEYGQEVGRLIGDLGFSMNLAPVLDLSNPQEPSFIGVRSFGGNPKDVSNFGYSIAKGLQKSKIIPTAKHFPGLGSSLDDSHSSLVTRITSMDEFLATDLKPFEKFAELGPESAVMVSHLSYPVVDPANIPALFSEKVVTGLLRKKLAFKGVILTDDLMMQGASQFANPGDAAVMTLKAGTDIVMVTWSFRAQMKAFLRVKEAIQKNELPMSFVEEKIQRILVAKSLAGLTSDTTSTPESFSRKLAQNQDLPREKLKQIESTVLESNLRAQDQKFETIKTASRLCIVSPSQHFLQSFKNGTNLKLKYVLMNTISPQMTFEKLLSKNGCDNSVLSIYGQKTTFLAEGLSSEAKAHVMLVNLNAPMSLVDEAAYLSVVNLYFPHASAGQVLAQHLFHRKPATASYSPRATSK